MSTRERRQVASDAGLSKQRVVVEAVRLADREGVDGLSMRRLAGALSAGAMSLYHYVANKDELLDAMIDVVFDEIELPPEDSDWQSAMRRRAVSAREVLARHPWAIGLMESRTSPGPANLRHREAVTACLRRAGFSVVMATHANWLLDSYVYGFARQQANLSSGEPGSPETAAQMLAEIPTDQFPHLTEVITHYIHQGGYDPDADFDFGLTLILDSLARLLDQAPQPEDDGHAIGP